MEQGQSKNDFFEKVKTISKNATKAVADFTVDIAENTRDAVVSAAEKVNTAIDEKKVAAENVRKEKFDATILPLAGTEAEAFIYALGDSPVKLTDGKVKQIKETFPVPREQNILWADAEFDLRPSGIIVTDKGVFIRTNVPMLDGKVGVSNFALDDLDGDEQQTYLQHQAQYHSGKAVLLFYSWNDFDASWFAGKSEMENKALLVEPHCYKIFVEVCRAHAVQVVSDGTIPTDLGEINSALDEKTIKTSVAAGAAVESSQIAIFAEHMFEGLKKIGIVEQDSENPYLDVIKYLNGLTPKQSFFFREFSPSGTPLNGCPPRKYFTSENAGKIDAIREKINEWIESRTICPYAEARINEQ